LGIEIPFFPLFAQSWAMQHDEVLAQVAAKFANAYRGMDPFSGDANAECGDL
jgi:hypothetical protein